MKKISTTLLFLAVMTLPAIGQTNTGKVVNYGIRASANLAQPVLRGIPIDIKASPAVGAEGGAFLDFNIGPRFFIRLNTLYSLQHSTLTIDGSACPLLSASVVVPVYAAWRFGDVRRGWCFVGVGPYTEFVTWGRLQAGGSAFNPYHHVIDVNALTGAQTLAMTDSHSGFGAMLGYELPCGLFADFTAQMALTDLLAFDHGGGMWVRPLKLTLGFGWRW